MYIWNKLLHLTLYLAEYTTIQLQALKEGPESIISGRKTLIVSIATKAVSLAEASFQFYWKIIPQKDKEKPQDRLHKIRVFMSVSKWNNSLGHLSCGSGRLSCVRLESVIGVAYGVGAGNIPQPRKNRTCIYLTMLICCFFGLTWFFTHQLWPKCSPFLLKHLYILLKKIFF